MLTSMCMLEPDESARTERGQSNLGSEGQLARLSVPSIDEGILCQLATNDDVFLRSGQQQNEHPPTLSNVRPTSLSVAP
jgi:hypothetical protein